MRTITLRIKRCYLEQISNGEKTVEFRESKKFYHSMFRDADKITHVKLHYQRRRTIVCEVKRIDHISLTDQVQFYAIHLGMVVFER